MTTAALSSRHQEILDIARQRGFVSIDDLATRFRVTPQTIRRDINSLCDYGLLERHHGGATSSSSVENEPYGARRSQQSEAKEAIAEAAAQLVPDRASLFVNIGTTTEAVARHLLDHEGLRVVTNNLNVAGTLSANADCEAIITGGKVRSRDRAVIGEASVDFIRQFKLDFAVIGISGIDVDGSLLDFDIGEVRAAQAIIANARKVILVADHTKFGRKAMARMNSMEAVDIFVTDQAPPENYSDMIRRCETEIVIAGSK